MNFFHNCLIFVISWSNDWRWQSQKVYANSNLIIYWTNVSDCHCIACNTIEVTYRNKYNLIAQMFLIMIDLDTLRLVDQSEVLILFVLIFQSSVIVLFNKNCNNFFSLSMIVENFFLISYSCNSRERSNHKHAIWNDRIVRIHNERIDEKIF